MQYVWGKRACGCQVQAAPMIEDKLGRRPRLYQGSYSFADASAGTHSRGGAWDTYWSEVDTDREVLAWRECGTTMSPRPAMSPLHGHGILIGCPHVSAAAARQVVDHRAGRNGLANRGRDRYPRPRLLLTWRQALGRWRAQQAAKRPAPINVDREVALL